MGRFNKFLIAVLALASTFGLTGSVSAATTTVDLKTAASFAILAGTEITNVPTSIITGNVGLSPAAGSFIGLTQPQVTGTMYAVDATGPAGTAGTPSDKTLVDNAKLDLTAAYDDAAGRTPVTTLDSAELGGRTLTDGVYTTGSTALQITGGADGPGALVLDAQNDPNAVFIFEGSGESAGTLTVNPGGTVELRNGACASNVFWRVYGATIFESAVFKGTILAYTSITVAGGVGTVSNIEGRLLAQIGNVTLDHTTVSVPTTCATSTVAAATPTTTAAAAAAKLPNTGLTSSQNNIPWSVAVLAGVFALSTLFVLIRRKKRAI